MAERPVILVVDDDAPILLLMRNLLREFGFDPLTANNGNDAIEQARTHRPHLILLDRNMPGMSGDEVLRRLREESAVAKTPVLMLSGEPIDPDELQQIGATAAVLKPFDVPALMDAIRTYVAGA